MKYSALDIDRMRAAIRYLAAPNGIALGSFYTSETLAQTARIVETQLLTYMANETTADELEALVEERQEKERCDFEAWFKARMEIEAQSKQPLVLGREPSRVPHVSPSGVIKQKRRRWWRRLRSPPR